MPVALPAPGQELPALRHRHPQPLDVARGQPRARGELAQLRAPAREPLPLGGGPLRRCRCSSPTPSRRTTSPGSSSAAAAPATRASTRPTAVRSRTRTSPTTSWPTCPRSGARTRPSSASTTSTATSRRASSRASTARSTSATTRTTRSTPATATPTPPPASSTDLHPGQQVRAAGVGLQQLRVVRPGQLEGQPQAHARLRRALLLPDARSGTRRCRPRTSCPSASTPPTRRGCSGRSASAPLPAPAPTAAAWTRALVSSGVTPTLGNTVEERFIGRLVPGSNRFNGAFQAGQGIDEKLQDGNAFRISPRFGFTYDISGSQSTIVRGGFGIFYDRPQGNQVFDMIANAPGVLVSNLQWGRLQDLSSASTGSDPNPTLVPEPLGLRLQAAEGLPSGTWACSASSWSTLIFDLAYVGSKSTDLLRQSQINAVPRGAKFLPQNQDPTRAPSATPGRDGAAGRPAAALSRLRQHPHVGLHRLAATTTRCRPSVTRRFDKGFMFSAFYVWSKALTINNDDFSAGLPNADRGGGPARRLLVRRTTTGRTTSWSTSSTRCPRSRAARSASWPTTGRSRASTAGRAAGPTPSPSRSRASAPPTSSATTATRARASRSPATRARAASSDPYKQIEHPECFAPPQPGSDGAESARFFLRNPPTNNLDLSIAKKFLVGKGRSASRCASTRSTRSTTRSSSRRATTNGRQLREPDQPDHHEPAATTPTGTSSGTTASAPSTAWPRLASFSS